jgi:hypothetical protein
MLVLALLFAYFVPRYWPALRSSTTFPGRGGRMGVSVRSAEA